MRLNDHNPLNSDSPAGATPDSPSRKRLQVITASTVLAFYGYELLFMPFAVAAQAQSTPSSIAVSKQPVYLLYVPQTGEQLSEAAQRFGVEESTLSALRSQAVSQGWSEQIWLVPKGTGGEAALYPGYVLHTLQSGESLSSLAVRSNRSERELTRLNTSVLGADALAKLKPGAQVVLPAPLVSSEAARDAAANKQALAFEQRLAQNVAQLSQSYGAGKGASASGLLAQQVAGYGSSALSQGLEEFLSPYGRAKIGVRTDTETRDVDLELDYLHPLLEDARSIFFTQVGTRRFDDRQLGNVGLGYRHQIDTNLMLGANAFIDQDFTRDHTRAGLGLEAWTNTARLAANAYAPLSDWKRSDQHRLNTDPQRFELFERPARGWDARGEALVPGIPQLAATARYFKWYGDGVDAFGGGQLEKDPAGHGLGLRWQPVPLLGLSAEHQKIRSGDSRWELGLSLNWTFDRDLSKQLSTSDSVALRPLSEARKDFVERDYNVVLDYKQKEKPVVTPFAFASSELVLQAPPLGAPNDLIQDSPALQGVRPGAVVTYSLAGAATRAVSSVSIDPNSGKITVPVGASTQQFTATSTHSLNGVVLDTASYTLHIKETLDTTAPAAPTVAVADSNNDGKPEASGQTEVGSTVVVTWPDASTSSAVADANGRWSLEAAAIQPSGSVTVVATDASGNVSATGSASWENLSAPVAKDVSISGTPEVGQVLTGSYTYSDAENDPEGASQLQWYRHATPIAGATSSTYTLVVADEGQTLSYAVTPVAQTGTPNSGLQVKSAATAAIAPKPGAAPTLRSVTITGSGVPTVSSPLQAVIDYDDADGDLAGVHLYQWYRDGAAISGATSERYTPVILDEGKTLTVAVTPVALTGAPKIGTAVTSSATPPIAAASGVAPVVSAVTINGTVEVGQALTVTYSYSDADQDLEGASLIQWLRNGVAIAGATSSTYTLEAADEDQVISVSVTPVALSGTPVSGTAVTSAATAAVLGRPGSAPEIHGPNVAALGGVPTVGLEMIATYSNYFDADGDLQDSAPKYQWYRSGTAIVGATQGIYHAVVADEGHTLSVGFTAVALTGQPRIGVEVRSAESAVVAPKVGSVPVATVSPISGPVTVGDVLTANYTYSDADGDAEGATEIRWHSQRGNFTGVTGPTYTVRGGDAGDVVFFYVTPVALTGAPKQGYATSSGFSTSVAARAVGNFLAPDTTLRNWADADAYCRNQGVRLPTVAELRAVRASALSGGASNMCETDGWPLESMCGGIAAAANTYYWTSDVVGSNHEAVYMFSGGLLDGVAADAFSFAVACTR